MAELLNIIEKTISLDIIDLNYGYGCESFGLLEGSHAAKPKAGYLQRIGNFFFRMGKFLIASIGESREDIPPHANLFFVDTQNQRDSLAPIARRMSNGFFVGTGNKGSISGVFPLFWAYLFSLPFFPLVAWRLHGSRGYKRKSFRYNIDYYWLTYGYFLVAVNWLRRLSPRVIIMSNDHNMPNRVVALAAKFACIPTIYIQHASVNKQFPPLSFDFALLDGTRALQAYNEAGESATKVFLIGTPKFDDYFASINKRHLLKNIGICTNHFDPIDRVDEVCRELSIRFADLRVSVRPHPGDSRQRDAWINLAKKYEYHFSDPNKELSFAFLERCEAIIVGDSNILLDAALLNVYPLYYDFGLTKWDWYGFCATGLIEYLAHVDELCARIRSLISSKPDIRSRCLPYCCTVGGRYDGRSSELAVSAINMILDSTDEFIKEWKRVSGVSLEAYQLSDGCVSVGLGNS